MPYPGSPPIFKIVNYLTHFLNTHANEQNLKEAREAVGLLSPQDIENLINSKDYSFSTTQYIHSLYEKALPNLRLYWIPTIVKADILSEFFKADQ